MSQRKQYSHGKRQDAPLSAATVETENSNKTVFLTGGGSGGHVVPLIGIVRRLRRATKDGIHIVFIGRKKGIERNLLESFADSYFTVPAGKWRRYFSFKNITDLFLVCSAFLKVFLLLYPHRKRGGKAGTVIFSTGGYVALPSSLAAFFLGIPVLIHEQTSRVGLANRVAGYLAKKIFLSFQSSKQFFSEKKCHWIGYPLSASIIYIKTNKRNSERQHEAFKEENLLDRIPKKKPLLLVTGGGNGSAFLNKLIARNMQDLEKKFFILHQTGRDHLSDAISNTSNSYLPVGFIFPQIFAELLYRASIVISRSGAGTVCECIYLNKKVLFIPLEISQRKEQYYNAKEASRVINCLIWRERDVKNRSLIEILKPLLQASKSHFLANNAVKGRNNHGPRSQSPKNSRFSKAYAASKSNRQGLYYKNKDQGKLALYQKQFKSASELITQNILVELGFEKEAADIRYSGGYRGAFPQNRRYFSKDKRSTKNSFPRTRGGSFPRKNSSSSSSNRRSSSSNSSNNSSTRATSSRAASTRNSSSTSKRYNSTRNSSNYRMK